jgi:hypothetical protein
MPQLQWLSECQRGKEQVARLMNHETSHCSHVAFHWQPVAELRVVLAKLIAILQQQ